MHADNYNKVIDCFSSSGNVTVMYVASQVSCRIRGGGGVDSSRRTH